MLLNKIFARKPQAAPQPRPGAAHAIHVLDASGDTMTTWDPADTISTEEARKVFGELRAMGYLTYRADEDPEVIKKFDPDAQTIIARRQMIGG